MLSNILNLKKKKVNNKQHSFKNKTKRTFKILDYPVKNKRYGNYKGNYPYQAAHKALNFLSKKMNVQNSNVENQIKFYLIETTNNSKNKNKITCYVGSKVKLKKPNIVNIGGKMINYHFKTIVSKCNEV